MRYLAIILIFLVMPAAVFSDMDIHSMVVNDRVLELEDTRQLSFAEDGKVTMAVPSPDFKWIAFLSEQDQVPRLCLVSSTGGKVTAVIAPTSLEKVMIEKGDLPKETWWPGDSLNWSPDGQLLAITATRYELPVDEQGKAYVPIDAPGLMNIQEHVVVLKKNGAFKTAIPLPAEARLYGELLFSPNSNLIASACQIMSDNESDSSKAVMGLIVFNVTESTAKVVFTAQRILPVIREWYPDGQSISWKPSPRLDKTQRVWLDGRVEDLDISWDESFDSPDGMFRYATNAGEPGICLKNIQTGELMQVIRDPDDASILCDWAPNSRMFAYMHEDTIVDKANSRTEKLNTLWLAHLGASRQNAMCIALDHEWCAGISQDCTRVAYVTDKGRLCVAELAWRDLTAAGKLAAGVPLTEQEERELIMENAKVIGRAIKMYATDWDEAYPDAGSIEDDLKLYIEAVSDRENAFNRPGTAQRIFTYLIEPGIKAGDITDPSATSIGEFDAGYDWKIVLYADGHVMHKRK